MLKLRIANIITAALLFPCVLVVQLIKYPLKWYCDIQDYLYIRRESKKAKREYGEFV